MPDTTLASVATSLREALANMTWRQWRALGASTSASAPATSIVDPEALVLISLGLRRGERRLTDVLAAWMSVNSSLISVQRIKNLRGAFPDTAPGDISWIAGVASTEGKDARWRSLAAEAPIVGVPHRRSKPRAVQPRFDSSTSLMLQLRCGMGVGVKADVLSFLLGAWNQGRDWASASAIAEATAYTPAAVRRAADDLSAARFIRTIERVEAANPGQRSYSVELSAWRSLLQASADGLRWSWWAQRLSFASDLLSLEEGHRHRPLSPFALATRGRELLERHRGTLSRGGMIDRSAFVDVSDWGSFLLRATREFLDWIETAT